MGTQPFRFCEDTRWVAAQSLLWPCTKAKATSPYRPFGPWFQQLRRLQSLKQSLDAGKSWRECCCLSCGIVGGHSSSSGVQGWIPVLARSRPTQLQASPATLPTAVPTQAQAIQIFLVFRDNYRRFEAWHIRQRCKVLGEKHKASQKELLRELRAPSPAQVDSLQVAKSYAILAADASTGQLFLDPPVDTRGISLWRLDDVLVSILVCDASNCTVQASCAGVSADVAELTQVQTLTALEDVQHEFVSLWGRRWSKHQDVDASHWQRVFSFTTAFLPPGNFQAPPLTPTLWLSAVRWFKPGAARGPDGYNKLLALLTEVEQGRLDWPEQLLLRLVCLLDKRNQRKDAQGYRPIPGTV